MRIALYFDYVCRALLKNKAMQSEQTKKQLTTALEALKTQRDALVDANDNMRKERDSATVKLEGCRERCAALDEEMGNLKQDKELAEVAAADFKMLANNSNAALMAFEKMSFELLKVDGVNEVRDAIILLKTSRDVNRNLLDDAKKTIASQNVEIEKLENMYRGAKILFFVALGAGILSSIICTIF